MSTTVTRKIIEIDEEKCDGCGLCVPNCAEGALQIVDGKAKLVADIYCDGLGACLGHCPQGAITIVERTAAAYDEEATMQRLATLGISHSDHAEKHHHEEEFSVVETKPAAHHPHGGGCPGSKMMDFRSPEQVDSTKQSEIPSQLRQWPIKINLVSPMAPYFQDAHLLLAADCAAFAYGGFHPDFIKGKAIAIGCPKFDDISRYLAKLTAICQFNDIKSITVAHMEVPCCFGLAQVARQAVEASGKDIPVNIEVVSVQG